MGSIRKKTATKPVPAGAEFFTRDGIRFARWASSGKAKTATKPVPAGAEFFVRDGLRFARWTTSAGKSKTARITVGLDGIERITDDKLKTAKITIGKDGLEKIVVESAVWLGKYSRPDGRIIE